MSEVNLGLLSRSLEGEIRATAATKHRGRLLALLNTMRSPLEYDCHLGTNVSTGSNLNRDVFEDLMLGLGVHAESVIAARPGVTDIDLDERLLARRNRIAHGSYIVPQEDECAVLVDAVRALLDETRTALMNYLVLEEFRAHA
jgi:hypothetical protein